MNTEHVALAIIINPQLQILLSQRFDPKIPSVHLKWQFPGGGVEKGESIADACIRETREEVGLTIHLLSQKPHELTNRYAGGTYILHGFLAEVVSGTIDVTQDAETHDARWFSLDEIDYKSCLDGTEEMIALCMRDYGREFITNKK